MRPDWQSRPELPQAAATRGGAEKRLGAYRKNEACLFFMELAHVPARMIYG
jgi:hypothetical protein